jgi:hypothetical protein
MTAKPGIAWATYRASGTLPAAVQTACEQLDTGDPNLPEPLGGKIANVMLDALLTVATP